MLQWRLHILLVPVEVVVEDSLLGRQFINIPKPIGTAQATDYVFF